ncbi:flagellar hook-associated protein FlgK [Aestuariivirga litoralis]|uniref:flagellar hook-associated protein FlgK n=1 Tax=Aestuariivirga litoralis TaxID=2650924 RepID=UPI0018C7BFE9|nr:flagellar hook-associated protein FlgK [Aestuariivirga litoralis]MBG1233180.1 flagellar hook-associated protein FlgK [Aestuariivirga litoralis]
MSGLTSALSNALAGLLVTSGQSAVVSRNITRASDPDYARETLAPTTNSDGGVQSGALQRAASKQLTDALLAATSDSAGQSSILAAFTSLSNTVGDVESDGSVAWGIDQLQQALQASESDPSNVTMANQVITQAKSLAQILNDASKKVEDVRETADTGIDTSVKNLNSLLAQFQKIDNSLSSGTISNDEKAAAQDQRDALLKQISQEIGIRTNQRADGSMAIYSDGGVTLYDRVPRTITFQPSLTLSASSAGNGVYADGVQILGANSPMPTKTGNIAAYAKVRDEVGPTYQNQLDEIARGLVTAFSEKDQSGGGGADATGLFSYSGSPAVPASGTLISGLAASISVNAAFDSGAGGNPNLVRDGGANGAAYKYNTTGVSGFQARLSSLMSAMSAPMTFSSATKLSSSYSLTGLATASAGWVEAGRSDATKVSTAADAVMSRATDALSRTTGVNIDDEMSQLLALEKSYQAAAKIMTTVNSMLGQLMDSVR